MMTQELIANMLCVRGVGVTEAVLKLQNAGLIRYARAHIDVLDRACLERRSCECYLAVKNGYDRLLPDTIASSPRTTGRGDTRRSPGVAPVHITGLTD